MDKTFARWAKTELVWLPELGMGFYPVEDQPYDAEYFEKYKGYADTPMGHALTQERVNLVNRYTKAPIVDVGIGCGQFVEARPNTFGYDINPAGVAYLRERGLWCDPTVTPIHSATFWDSLEHIHEPASVLDNIQVYAFVSLPIFRDANHILRSKHFRKDEHCWYWTHDGFVGWMSAKGFRHLETLHFESRLGRKDIFTYVFERE